MLNPDSNQPGGFTPCESAPGRRQRDISAGHAGLRAGGQRPGRLLNILRCTARQGLFPPKMSTVPRWRNSETPKTKGQLRPPGPCPGAMSELHRARLPSCQQLHQPFPQPVFQKRTPRHRKGKPPEEVSHSSGVKVRTQCQSLTPELNS